LVSEAKAEIARAQGTREGKQELYKVATRADGGAVREDDAEPELLDDEDMELKDGELVAMAVKTAFEPLHAKVERTIEGHEMPVECLVVHGDKLISGLDNNMIKVWNTDDWACERTLEGHTYAVISLVVHGDKLIQRLRRQNDQTMEHQYLGVRAHPRRPHSNCVLLGDAWRQADQWLRRPHDQSVEH
jgi:hypothetical protein